MEIEIDNMGHLKTTTMPVIIGALGMINKEIDKHIYKIPSSPSLYEIQNITLCRIAPLLRRVLSM